MDVLLIEDTTSDAVLIRAHLERAAGKSIRVVHAWRLADGIAELEQRSFDVVLLDLGLPDSNGLDGLRLIKTVGRDVPVIVLTGDTSEAQAFDAVKHGAQDYLNKDQLSGPVLARSLHYATERHQLQEELRHQASHDPLTGLPNRKHFDEQIEAAINSTKPGHHNCAVALLDLDGFKIVNDLSGHEAGDRLLVEVASRLKSCTRKGDAVGRLGGDEFALLIHGVSSRSEAEHAVHRVQESLTTSVQIGSTQHTISACIGIALADEITANCPATMRKELLRNADMAMYAAKESGAGRKQCFDQQLDDSLSQRSRIEVELQGAQQNGELFLHYQPIVDLDSRDVVGLEALCRWQPPGQAMIPPDVFIPVAEKTGAIVSIGRWVIQQACRDFAVWKYSMQDEAPDHLSIHVNISIVQLSDESLVPTIADSLEQYDVAPDELVIEVTESCFGGDQELALRVLSEIRNLGVGLSIDDFGTGYSSLGQLRRLPFTGMKIDRSFIVQLDDENHEGEVFLEAMTTLATALKMTTVAEGIETESQAVRVRDAGCQYAQGFLFARPARIEDVIQSLTCRSLVNL